MLALTSPVRTRYHSIPAGRKLLTLLAFTAALMWVENLALLALLLAAVAAAHLAEGRAFLRFGLGNLRPLWPLALVLLAWQAWMGSPAGGLAMVLRLAVAIACANLVTSTTRLDDMIAVVQRVAAPLRHVGLSPGVLAMAFALTIRFIPVMGERMAQISEAVRARGGRNWRALAPAALAALDEAEHVAEALRARGGI